MSWANWQLVKIISYSKQQVANVSKKAKIIIRRCFWRWNLQYKARDIYNQLSCHPIGQLCLGGSSYSSRTVSAQGLTEPRPAAEVQSVNRLVTTRTTPKIACCVQGYFAHIPRTISNWMFFISFCFITREFKLHVYSKRQTSDSSWEFLKIENEQIKTAQHNSYG